MVLAGNDDINNSFGVLEEIAKQWSQRENLKMLET